MTTTHFELKDLADFLLLNASFCGDNSLQGGKTAVALFFFYAQKNKAFITSPQVAYSWLEEILNEDYPYNSIYYATGALGGGVVLEHLVQEGMLPKAASEPLKSIESHWLEQLFSETTHTIDLATGFSGGGLYLLYRLNDPAIHNTPSYPYYKMHLQNCLERVVKHFPFYRPSEYLHQEETAVWNGLTGVLLFLIKAGQSGIYSAQSEKVQMDIAERLLCHIRSNDFSWSKAEAFLGLLQYTEAAKNETWQQEVIEFFKVFIEDGFNKLPDIDLSNAAFVAVLIRLLGQQYNCHEAIRLSDEIGIKVKTALTQKSIRERFDRTAYGLPFKMGLYRGVCGTALALLSLETGDYKWLQVLGIEIKEQLPTCGN